MIKALTAIDAWKKSIKALLDQEVKSGRRRSFREIENYMIEIKNLNDWLKPLTILEKVTPWEYPDIEDISNYLLSPVKPQIFQFTYGERISNFNGYNQLEEHVIPLLQKVPKTRRAVISIVQPEKDLFIENRAIPALLSIQFRRNKENIDIYFLMRSLDVFLGLPFNMLNAYILQKYVAKRLNLIPGKLSIYSTSAQLYNDYEEYIEEVLRLID